MACGHPRPGPSTRFAPPGVKEMAAAVPRPAASPASSPRLTFEREDEPPCPTPPAPPTTTSTTPGRQRHAGPGPDQGPWAPGFRPDQRSDNELLAAYVGGDTEAFGEFTRRYFHFMVAVAARRIGWWRFDDAEDAAANALIDVMSKADQIGPDGIAEVKSWLASIVRNHAMRIVAGYAQRRTPVREPHVIREVITSGGYRLPGTSGPAQGCAESEREARDEQVAAFAARIGEVLARLTPLQREVITRRRLRGMTQREIAAELGRPLSSVKGAEARAKLALRRELADLLDQRPRH